MFVSRHLILVIATTAALANPASVDSGPHSMADKYWVYIGTYTSGGGSQGIYRSEFDMKSGVMNQPVLAAELANPSFLAISPNEKFLYAVGETADGGPQRKEGAVHAFQIDGQSGALAKLNHLTTGGGGPCYVSVNRTGRFALVANYGGGSSALFQLNDDGSLSKRTDFRQHEGKSVNKDRQQA